MFENEVSGIYSTPTTSWMLLCLLPPITFSSTHVTGYKEIAPTTHKKVAMNCEIMTKAVPMPRNGRRNLMNSLVWYRSF